MRRVQTYVPTLAIAIPVLLALGALWVLRDPAQAGYASALATVALCALTAWYAWLTHRLVIQNRAQMQLLHRTELDRQLAEAKTLASIADRVGAAVRELPAHPDQPGFDRDIRLGILWQREDLRDLERLASRLGPWATEPLIQVINYVNWMAARVVEVQAVHPSQGFDYTRFPREKWTWAWQETDKHLALLAKLARDAAERLSREAGDAA